MQASDELLTIAEIAIALAGFSGVVVAFAHQGRLTRLDRWRFGSLLAVAMSAVATAFVPSILHYAGLTGPPVWRIASATFLVISIPFFVVLVPRVARIAIDAGATPPKAFILPTFGLSALNLAAQLCNVLGWPTEPGPALFLFGLVGWLIVSAIFFGLLVLGRPREESTT